MKPLITTIEPAPVELKPLMQTLMNLYFYDLAEYATAEDWNPDLGEDGIYPNRYFAPYWTAEGIAEGRRPFLIRVSGKPAGHIYVNQHSFSGKSDQSLAEFFVLRKFRGLGVGRAAAWLTFGLFPGVWEVAQTRKNFPAQAFWRKTISRYLAQTPEAGSYEEFTDPGEWLGPVQVFRSKPGC